MTTRQDTRTTSAGPMKDGVPGTAPRGSRARRLPLAAAALAVLVGSGTAAVLVASGDTPEPAPVVVDGGTTDQRFGSADAAEQWLQD